MIQIILNVLVFLIFWLHRVRINRLQSRVFIRVEQLSDVHSENAKGSHQEDKRNEDVVANVFIEIEGLIYHVLLIIDISMRWISAPSK